ncbi:MAG: tRNA 4-thiouridine(8) synthase ThiI [Treponema sp.]|nr:tRNA 4-thiouridine(8) synthase ThiI [Treponema sp.]
MSTYLGKIGELTLKGSNLKEFERRLMHNAQLYLEGVKSHIRLFAGRLYIDADDSACPAIEFMLNHLIGITGWAKAHVCEKNIESIKAAVMEEALKAKERGAKSFKVDTRRADKSFPLTSYQINCQTADDIYDKNLLTVDVHKPDVVINIEIRDRVFVFCDQNVGCRGLPVGVSGKGLLLLSGGIDSPVAGYRMMRRGMNVDAVYFHSYPYTSEEAQQKVEKLAETIANYGVSVHLNIIPFTDTQMRIKERAPAAWTTLMLRVCMMKTANMIAERIGAQCIITGESLGQVASQTIENMTVTEAFAERPLLRPLVGLDKEEIVDTANFIDTYETSILPYEDCCVLFSPRHPVLRGTVEEAQDIYKKLEIDELIQQAFDNRVVKRYSARDYTIAHYPATITADN